jgi:starch synthase
MNIIVDDDDFPLIIKVASLPGARMQVYFLDNEDFFKRKSVFEDSKGKPFKDNADRMVFFCKGVIETVKKFGWPPDIVHCHGWMTSLVPFYLKTAYKNEPLFQNSKVVYSLYESLMDQSFGDQFLEKATINNLEPEDMKDFTEDGKIALNKGAIMSADGIINGSVNVSEIDEKAMSGLEVPILEYQNEEAYLAAYLEFFNNLMESEVETEAE